MKKIYKKIITRNEIYKIKYFCDLCKEEFIVDSYEISSSKVIFKSGSHYPGTGNEEGEQAYFCKSCAVKIKDVLVKLGVKFEKFERVW